MAPSGSCCVSSPTEGPGLIRVDADETTYSLHIILRFELEQEIIDGRIRLEELPEVWNARFKDFLGVDVPDELPDLDDQLAAGDALQLGDWLRDRLYRHGRKYTPKEMLERVAGTPTIDSEPYLAYLREKVEGLRAVAV